MRNFRHSAITILDKNGICTFEVVHPPRTIIGKARISEVKHYNTTDEFTKDYPRHHCKFFGKYDYGFILDNIEKIEPDFGNIAGKRFFFFLRQSFNV